ncbi:MAG: hypothetical protein ACKPB2_21075 [Sphaerospermopsis kisseleviana]
MQQCFAIALPHPKSDRPPTPQTAIALHTKKRSHSHTPKKAITPSHPQKAIALLTSPKAIPSVRFAKAPRLKLSKPP